MCEFLNMQTDVLSYPYSEAAKPNHRPIILLLAQLACREKMCSHAEARILFTRSLHSPLDSVAVVLARPISLFELYSAIQSPQVRSAPGQWHEPGSELGRLRDRPWDQAEFIIVHSQVALPSWKY